MTSSPSFYCSQFADRLRDARLTKGITQTQAAKHAGIQPAAWSHFETGQRTPCIRNLRAICIAVDVSADHLLGLAPKPPEECEPCGTGRGEKCWGHCVMPNTEIERLTHHEIVGGSVEVLESQPWFMWTENKLSLCDRIKIIFGWKIYTRFDAPTGQCSGGCDMRHQITPAKYDDVNWQNSQAQARPALPDAECFKQPTNEIK